MRYVSIASLVLLLSLLWAVPPRAAEPPAQDELAEKVRKAIDRAVKFLRDQEKGGDWEKDVLYNGVTKGGMSALATLALLYAGVPPEDKIIQDSLKFLRKLEPEAAGRTYVVALQTMVYALANQPEDKERIQRCVDWLIAARLVRGGRLSGWTYSKAGGGNPADNSNTQYAVLGLHEGFQAGAKVDAGIWEEIYALYLNSMIKQGDAGGWAYRTGMSPPTMTMTTAGVCGLLIADMDLKASKLKGAPNCGGNDCGEAEDEAVNLALKWIGRHMPGRPVDISQLDHTYYCLYGIERTGRFSGQRFLGEKDWYRIGCEYFVGNRGGGGPVQNNDGSFVGNGADTVPIIGTSFALLFLAKGRTPVLISKMVHDPEEDWHRNRSDARNLTNFCSNELFKHTPLAWQVFDARRAGDLDTRLDQLTAELLQSPIAYVSGKKPPPLQGGGGKAPARLPRQRRLPPGRGVLRQPRLRQGLPRPDQRTHLQQAGRSQAAEAAREPPGLHRQRQVRGGPQQIPAVGHRERLQNHRHLQPARLVLLVGRQLRPRRQGEGNLRAGRQHRRLRHRPGTAAAAADANGGGQGRDREEGAARLPESRTGAASRRPAAGAQAMPNLMTEMRKLGVDVALQTQELALNHPDLTDFRFLYMHGRHDFSLGDQELKNLRFHLESGGLLFADACCGSKQFDTGFRKMIKGLWPDKELEPIPGKDELFSKELNGEAITTVQCRREGADGKPASTDFRTVAPALEGIKHNGRWVVIYSKYDIGCALEKHQSTDCLGHDHASAVRLGKAAVLYAMRR